MAAFLDLCRFTPTAGGTSDWTFSASVAPCQSPAAAGAVSGTVYKVIAVSNDLSQMEIAEGAYNSGTGVFARTTVLFNSSGTGTRPGQSGAGTKINFSTVPQVAVIGIKEDLISIEEANSFTAKQKAQARANIDVLKKNYILNGAMMVSQENGTTAGTATGYYPVDQFFLTFANTTGILSVAQVASATPGGSPNRLRATVTTADASLGATDYVYLATRVEGLRAADLLFGSASAKAVILQFGVKAPAGTYCVIVRNAAVNRCYVAEYTIAAGEANADVVKSVTIPGDTTGIWAKDNTVGLEIRWGLMCGSSEQFAAGSWGAPGDVIAGSSNQFNFMGTLSNVFELFDVGLYEGAAPSFQVPDFQTELSTLKRYWETSYSYGTAPGTASAGGSEAKIVGTNSVISGTDSGIVTFYEPKRVTPTMTIYGFGGTVGAISSQNGTDNAGTASTVGVGTRSFIVRSTGSFTTTSLEIIFHWKADARM